MSTLDLTSNSHSEDSGVTDMSTSTEKVGELLMFKFDLLNQLVKSQIGHVSHVEKVFLTEFQCPFIETPQ